MNKVESKNIALPASRYLRAAGASYLFVIIVGMLSTLLIDSRLVVGDNEAIARNIIAHELLFRVGIVAVLAMYAGVVVLSVSLYVVLRVIDEDFARLAMLLRVAEAILGAATTLLSFLALSLLTVGAGTNEFDFEEARALAVLLLDVRTAGLDIVLIFVGLGGTGFCYLFYKSSYVPRVLAAWGVFTYLSMLVLASVSIVFPQHPIVLETALYSNGALFEVVFGAWLLFRRFDGSLEARGRSA